jgi:hypothetical protein|tara:strand:- start:3220 stop:3594 length:375 start_codon:yes stop_codon:yes gene_type:complete
VISLAAAKTKKKVAVKQQKNSDKKNKHLVKHQWKKGQSGNPNGRPKSGFALNEYITDLANVELEDKKTMLEAVVGKVYEEALDGNMTAINFLADRILGKPSQSIGIKDVSDEPIKVFDIDGLDD